MKLLFRLVLCCIFMLLISISVIGQRDPALVVTHFDRQKEGFFYLADSIIASELASFNFVGRIYRQKPSEPLIAFDVSEVSTGSAGFKYGNSSVYIETGRFRPAQHHLQYYRRSAWLYKIDGRFYWGIEGKVPLRKIENMSVVIDGKSVRMANYAYNDIFESNLCVRMFITGRVECETAVYVSQDGERIYIYMRNGKIPSLYEITWIFRNGRYIGRVIDYAY